MRTNIVIDDTLMQQAQAALGVRTKREAVEEALRRVVQMERQKDIGKLWGIGWEGDLEAMRLD